MQHAALSKLDFVFDLIKLAFGSTIGLIVVGAIVAGVILLYIVGKVMNMREENGDAARGDGSGVRLDK